MSAERMEGKVKWFDAGRGYGFITAADGQDLFVHFSGIRGEGFRTLSDGAAVEFIASRGPKGLVAIDVFEP